MEEHVVHGAEDNRGSADPKSQRDDGNEGETTTFAEVAEGVLEVAAETGEVGFHTSKLYTEAPANCRTSRWMRCSFSGAFSFAEIATRYPSAQ